MTVIYGATGMKKDVEKLFFWSEQHSNNLVMIKHQAKSISSRKRAPRSAVQNFRVCDTWYCEGFRNFPTDDLEKRILNKMNFYRTWQRIETGRRIVDLCSTHFDQRRQLRLIRHHRVSKRIEITRVCY